MGRSKKDAKVTNLKRKGALAMAESSAANAKRVAEKGKEQSEEEGDNGSTASENEILQLDAVAEIKAGQRKLQALERNRQYLKQKCCR